MITMGDVGFAIEASNQTQFAKFFKESKQTRASKRETQFRIKKNIYIEKKFAFNLFFHIACFAQKMICY